MDNDISWQCSAFAELSNEQLYALLRLRQEVFVLEQNCLYQDLDGNDQLALHIQGYRSGKLVAYSRILCPNTRFKEPSIGRVIVSSCERASGLGYQLMQESLAACRDLYPSQSIRISAQVHLKSFYAKLGFEVSSEVYDEDGIAHAEMLAR